MRMIICNKRMILTLLTCRNHIVDFPPDLLQIVQDGLIIKEGCILLKNFYVANRRHTQPRQFDDLTAYETFVNGFIINDFCQNNFLKNGLLFVNQICDIVDNAFPQINLEMILCKSSSNVHFTMHTLRPDEVPYLNDNLEDYIEPTMIIRHLVQGGTK